MNDVELIVLDLDGGDHLIRCLQSIAEQTVQPSKVLIFDNGSRVPVSQRLGSLDLVSFEVLRSEKNLGFTGGINQAMKHVRTPFVGWVNNDVVLDPEWVRTLRDRLAGAPRLAAVQSVILQPDGRIDGAGIDISNGTFRQLHHGRSVTEIDASVKAWGVSATAAMYRVDALADDSLPVGPLHPGFFAYYEDVDLCARLLARGWELFVDPRPLAVHHGSASASQLGTEALRYRVRNRYRVARAHRGVGSVASLLAEDFRRAGRVLILGDIGSAAVILRSVIAGMRDA